VKQGGNVLAVALMSVDPEEVAEQGGELLLDETVVAAALASAAAPPRTGRQQTARRAVEILVAKGQGFHAPTGLEREALAIAFARKRKVIYGAAFDVVRLARELDLTDAEQIFTHLDAVELLEVKSTNRAAIGADFRGYFFALTTAELLVAQSLGPQFKFAFVNTISEDHIELSLQEVFTRSRGIYPTWSIRF
jgi:hypothetical protein